MDVIFVIGIAQAFFFALLLSRKKNRSVADNILMGWLVFIGLHLLWFYWDHTGVTSRHPHLFGPNRFMPAAEGPFLWIYAQALLTGATKFKWKWLLHFVPFLVLNLLVINIYILPAEAKLEFMKVTLPTSAPWQAHLGNFFNLFSGPLYVLLLLAQLKKIKVRMKDFFSSEKVNFRWLQQLAFGLGCIWIVVLSSAAYCAITDSRLPEREGYYIFLAVSLYVLFLGYHGLRHENILVKYTPTIESENKPSDKYARSGLKPPQEKELLLQIKQVMGSGKLYMEPNLTLDDLVNKLSMPRHYVSQAIGSERGQTFFTLVNRYRVEEARKKLVSSDFTHFSLLGIGLDCGFNSKASFNRIFKEYTGQTPSQYKENLKAVATK